LQRYDRSSISEQQAGHFMALPNTLSIVPEDTTKKSAGGHGPPRFCRLFHNN